MGKQYKQETLAKKIYESLNEVDYDPNYSNYDHLDDESKRLFVNLASSLIDGSFSLDRQSHWYEKDGVFDTPKWVVYGGNRILIDRYDGMSLISEGRRYEPLDCTPLTPEEAAKYGVDTK